MRKKNILLSTFFLAFGGICYIIFRENSYIAKVFNEFIYIDKIRNLFSFLSNDVMKYYLPDCLWGLSLSCGLIAIYTPSKSGVCICAFIAFTCGCL